MGPLDGLLPKNQNHGSAHSPTPHTPPHILNPQEFESSEESLSDSESEGNHLVRIFIDDENNPSFMASQPQNPDPDHKSRDSNQPPQISDPHATSPAQIEKEPETLVKLPILLPATNQDTSLQAPATVTPQQQQVNGSFQPTQEVASPSTVPLKPHILKKEIQNPSLLKPRSKPVPEPKNIIETPDDQFKAPVSENKRDRKKQPFIRPKPSQFQLKSQKLVEDYKNDVDPRTMRALHLARQHEEVLASRRFELKEAFYCRRVKQQIFEGMRLNEYHRFWTSSAHKPGNLYAHHQNHIKEMLRTKRSAYLASRQNQLSSAKSKKTIQQEMLESGRQKDIETANRLEKMSNQCIPDPSTFGPPKGNHQDFKAPVRPGTLKSKSLLIQANGASTGSSSDQLVKRLEKLQSSTYKKTTENSNTLIMKKIEELHHNDLQSGMNYQTAKYGAQVPVPYKYPTTNPQLGMHGQRMNHPSLVQRINKVLENKEGLCRHCHQRQAKTQAGLCLECYHSYFKRPDGGYS